ncbi:hypothetical protein V1525DRAFT_442373 [Lipomyces kononenkoae]|uniref:Uncharacterized protein n=1 Tax=Lipomyces kononenkoae TaxID=34357 RepID=A0ACC3SQQ3_LIPKO
MAVSEVFKALTHFRLQRESMTQGKGLAESTESTKRSAAYMSEAYPRKRRMHRDRQPRFRARQDKGKGKGFDRSDLRCWNCGGRFHTRNTCRKPHTGKAESKGFKNPTTSLSRPARSEERSVNMVSTDTRSHATPTSPRNNEKDVIDLKIDTDVDESLYELDSFNEHSLDWYMDTGATSHVCNNLKLFHTYKPFNIPERVKFGGKSTGAMLGTGTIILKLRKPNGSRYNLRLHDVFYVPEVRKNLLSGYRLSLEHIQLKRRDVLRHKP